MPTGAYIEVRDRGITQARHSIAPLICVLTLALFVGLVFRTNHHNFAVSFNYFAFIAHRLY